VDALAEFFPLLLFILYALLRGLRGRKKAPQQATPAPGVEPGQTPQSAQPQTDFDELARHLESLISGSPVEAKPPPPPPEPRYEPEFHSSEVEIDEAASFQHQQHGFGAENPLSEESFERQPAFAPTRRSAKTSFDPHALKRQPEVPKAPASNWRTRLADPKRAREAVVLQTILERPQERKR